VQQPMATNKTVSLDSDTWQQATDKNDNSDKNDPLRVTGGKIVKALDQLGATHSNNSAMCVTDVYEHITGRTAADVANDNDNDKKRPLAGFVAAAKSAKAGNDHNDHLSQLLNDLDADGVEFKRIGDTSGYDKWYLTLVDA